MSIPAAPGRRLRCLVAAFGDPGHVFPAVSLSRALAARGHDVVVETWPQWEKTVKEQGLTFEGADQYQVFPPPRAGFPGGGEAALALMPLLESFQPDLVINDVLTVAPALAAERFGASRATLVPHLFPEQRPGLPMFSSGALPPRTPIGRLLWRRSESLMRHGLIRGREDLNAQRAIVGLPPTDRFHGATSPDLTLVATFPGLEYPGPLPDRVQITGPMHFEIDHPDIDLPPGDEPLVLVAPSTSQDPGNRLVRAALEGLADLPVRVVATTNRVRPATPLEVPDNAVLVDWVRYSQVMPEASVVVCHGGHGTVARSLAAGTPLVVCPVAGDMNENAARVTWAGAGLGIRWSLLGPRSLKWALGEILNDPSYATSAARFAEWDRTHDGPTRGAELVEALVG